MRKTNKIIPIIPIKLKFWVRLYIYVLTLKYPKFSIISIISSRIIPIIPIFSSETSIYKNSFSFNQNQYNQINLVGVVGRVDEPI